MSPTRNGLTSTTIFWEIKLFSLTVKTVEAEHVSIPSTDPRNKNILVLWSRYEITISAMSTRVVIHPLYPVTTDNQITMKRKYQTTDRIEEETSDDEMSEDKILQSEKSQEEKRREEVVA